MILAISNDNDHEFLIPDEHQEAARQLLSGKISQVAIGNGVIIRAVSYTGPCTTGEPGSRVFHLKVADQEPSGIGPA